MKPSKKLLFSILAFLLSYGFLFLLWSFVIMSFDPHDWAIGERFGYASISFLLGSAISAFFYITE